ncbi:MAG: ComEA family DNA-binding protein, partial [Planctomycetota bacterium]
MSPSGSIAYDFTWNRRNLAGLIAFTIAAGFVLGLRGFSPRAELGEQIAIYPDRLAAAREFINPNDASAASLRRLPGIGEKIAQGIVEYRSQHAPAPYRSADDLE